MFKQKTRRTDVNGIYVVSALLMVTGIVLLSLHLSGVFKGSRGPAGPAGINGTDGAAGPPGPAGVDGAGTTPEAFAVTLNAPYVFSTNFYEPITNLTATVFTDGFPDVSPRTFFVDVTTSTMNLATGVFTVGATGTYFVSFTHLFSASGCSPSFQLTINGAGNGMVHQGVEVYTSAIRLVAGDFVQVRGWTIDLPCTLPVNTLTDFQVPANSYSFMWAMAKIS